MKSSRNWERVVWARCIEPAILASTELSPSRSFPPHLQPIQSACDASSRKHGPSPLSTTPTFWPSTTLEATTQHHTWCVNCWRVKPISATPTMANAAARPADVRVRSHHPWGPEPTVRHLPYPIIDCI